MIIIDSFASIVIARYTIPNNLKQNLGASRPLTTADEIGVKCCKPYIKYAN